MTPTLSLHDALVQMQEAVKCGAMDKAKRLGTQSSCPLSLSTEDVRFISLLSTGAESRVFKGSFQSIPVAIKQLIIRTSFDLERFREELKIVASLHHPSIIPILGACLLPPHYFLVMPLEGASVYDVIHIDRRRLSWNEIIDIGYQLTGALAHVHEHGYLHRDVKTKNILVGHDGRMKLIDFGLAGGMNSRWNRGTAPSGGFHKRRVMGTLEYMAPEVLQNQGHEMGSDVYAFGVALNEMATGVYPFSDCTKANPDAHTILEMGYGRKELAAAVAAEGLRPRLPRDAPTEFVRLVETCWKLDATMRPSFRQLHDSFSQMLLQCGQLKIPSSVGFLKKTRGLSLSPAEHPLIDEEDETGQGGDWLFQSDEESDIRLSIGSFATAGYRGQDRMEDRHFIAENILDCPSTALIGVFDGHRGFETAEHAVNYFETVFKSKIQKSDSADDALTSTFQELEMKFAATSLSMVEEARGLRCPGCTAIAAFIHRSTIYIANAGDCRAVLCRDGAPLQLSRDHTASDDQERDRIQQLGTHHVRWESGCWRIGTVGLQVTRSLGDLDLKSIGVCADPEVTSTPIESSDTFLIVASDGLWDALSNEEAVKLVHDTVKHPELCAKRLVMEAIGRGSRDNITAAVAFLKLVETLETIYLNGTLTSGIESKSFVAKKTRLPQMSADEMSETL